MTYDHQSQYDPTASSVTRREGCTWTTGANGIAATTGGAKHPTPDAVHALVPRDQETDPKTPGWSIPDLVKAMGRYGMGLIDHTGEGWQALIALHQQGHYVALQGDSDQFGNATCSGTFDGNHMIGIYPRTKIEGGVTYWWIDDPICPTGRWERVAVLKNYATKLDRSIRFAAYRQQVASPHWQVKIPPKTRFAVFSVAGDRIVKTTTAVTTDGVDRPCSAPAPFHYPSGRTRRLVEIQGGGPRNGQHVNEKFAKEVGL